MADYANPISTMYSLGLFDFGGGAGQILSIKGPPGKTGVIKQIGASAVEIFATDSQTGKVRVGTAADNDAYAELIIPDGTADEAFHSQVEDTDAIKAAIPADQLVEINFVNGTDASAVTGQAHVWLLIDWF